MNLVDLLEGQELKQDDWSLSTPTFGEHGQLSVVGYFHTASLKKRKVHVVHCNICAKDIELFGEGYFRTGKGDITRNMIPCGCSKSVKWSKEQYAVLCSRKAKELGYRFLGFEDQAVTSRSRLLLECNSHGAWDTTTVSNFLKPDGQRGCPGCGRDKIETARRVPLEERLKKVSELCEGTPCKLLHVPEDYSHVFTRIIMTCSLHGDWETTMKAVTDGQLCPRCGIEKSAKIRTIPVDTLVLKFMATGAFVEGTIFTKIGYRKDGKSEWKVQCPDCNQSGVSTLSNLQQGKRPCACSPMRQQECYINLVYDGENTVAVKFGIANNSKLRVKTQNRLSIYDVKNFSVYVFPDIVSCKKAEQQCKKELETGVVSKEEMPDGWTETTYVYNLDKVRQIYKKYGGIEL